jgi:FG-GAP repeat
MRAIGRLAGFLVSAVIVIVVSGSAQSSAPSSYPAAPSHLKQVAYIKASNAEAGDHFGSGGSDTQYSGNALAISSDGTTMAVGAPSESSGTKGVNGDQSDHSVPGAGAVYVFTRKGDNWVQQAYIKASNPKRSSHFGSTIALSVDGNTMAVAAHWESSGATGVNGNQNDDSIPQAGAVYVFTRAGTAWSQQAYVKASNTGQPDKGDGTTDGDQFGYSLALSADGNTLAVGAISEDSSAKGVNGNQGDDSVPESGAAYVFIRVGRTWSQQAYIKASNTNRGDLFGYSMGISADGNTLAVAAYNEGSNSRQINGRQDTGLPVAPAQFMFSFEPPTRGSRRITLKAPDRSAMTRWATHWP